MSWYLDAMRVYRICGEELRCTAGTMHFPGLWQRQPKRSLRYSRMLRGGSDETCNRLALQLSTEKATSGLNDRYRIASWQCINNKLQEKNVHTYDEKSKEVIRNLSHEISPCDGLFIRPDVDRELHCVVSGPLTLNLGLAIDRGCEHLQRWRDWKSGPEYGRLSGT